MSLELTQALSNTANKLRVHSIKATTLAASGHPTTCMSAAEIVACLFFKVMRYDPQDASNPNNDRFLLSKGHAAPLLWGALAEAGAATEADIMTLRRIDSDYEGHPTPRIPWAYVGTGSLGQGLSIGVGMALDMKCLAKGDSRVYVLLGDGEVAEGAVWEAAALAAHYKLNNLTAIVDVNRLGQSQATMLGHDVDAHAARFAAFGWNAIVCDGHDVDDLLEAFDTAKATTDKPTVLVAKTLKGKGYAAVENQNGFHGKPFSEEECEKALAAIKVDSACANPPIEKPAPAPACTCACKCACSPEAPAPSYELGEEVATRVAYGDALAKLGEVDKRIVALDGDVKNSTFAITFMEAHPDRFFECYIAEQNMVGAGMGFATRGKIPFVSSFGAFLTRAYDQIRMAGVSQSNLKIVGSHAGVSIGEDGPSQMALEDFAMMRAIPNSVVLCPSDAVSSERAVALAAKHQGIVFIRTARPKTPVLYANDETFEIGGAKVLRESDQDKVTIAATGVTVHEALKAADALAADGIAVRVVDCYSIKPVAKDVLLSAAQASGMKIVTVEDHYPEGGLGEAVLSALATDGVSVHKMGVTGIPRSGKGPELMDAYGISAKCIVDEVRAVVSQRR